ncbi:terpene synthase family protein [Streptomyces sp. NBC_00287]|uniref:terpene synthase family protein n=1 Tax=Streptomyces sp. NBC_00287 TaxID=2975702 RepID=UPI002E2DB98F|nr:terpene synthase family protein [Streptomyces sp. NBC_00287]
MKSAPPDVSQLLERMGSFYLPPLPMRIPVRIHPEKARLEVMAWQWSRDFLCFDDERVGERYLDSTMEWSEFITPDWEFDTALLAVEWTCTLFLYDDLSRRSTLARAFVEAAPPGRFVAAEGWLARAVEDLWRRSTRTASPSAARRLEAALREFFRGCLKELPLRTRVGALRWQGWQTYLRMRRETIGMPVFMALAQVGHGPEVADEAFTACRAAANLVNDHVTLTNDVFSVRKELCSGDCVNGVVAWALHHGTGLQQAVDEACTLIDEKEREFLAERDRVSARFPHAAEYLDRLGHIISGNQHWNYITPRYHGEGYIWNGLKSGFVELSADRTVMRSGRAETR